MQIKSTSSRFDSTSRMGAATSIRSGIESRFDACLRAADQKRPGSNATDISAVRTIPNGNARCLLGTTSAAAPTVSHLLVDHPIYGRDCWDIVHSEINRDKLFTRITAGTEIYIDPKSGEITWDVSRNLPENNGPDFSTQADTDASRKDPGNRPHERFLIERAVSMAAAAYDLPRELISSVIKAESNFQVHAVSRAGAQGLMQLMPETARELGVDNPFDIRQNIDGGTRYLKKMLDLFGGNIEQALAAYNAGPGVMKRHQGRIPYPETRLYVQQILSSLDSTY